jgi:hypothetical protein
MTQYLVRWEIDIEADSPQEAAEKARACQTRWRSTATVFDVFEPMYEPHAVGGPTIRVATVDLSSPEESITHIQQRYAAPDLDITKAVPVPKTTWDQFCQLTFAATERHRSSR